MRVRRSHLCLLSVRDDDVLDIDALLQGDATVVTQPRLIGLTGGSGNEIRLDDEMFEVLRGVASTDWVSKKKLVKRLGFSGTAIDRLVKAGLLVSDKKSTKHTRIRSEDNAMRRTGWNIPAAAYHRTSSWLNFKAPPTPDAPPARLHQELLRESRCAIDKRIRQSGPPPSHFHNRRENPDVELPAPPRRSSLHQLLLARKSTRAFDVGCDLTVEQLNTVLYYTFGCHGIKTIAPPLVCQKKTSPAGGAMHATEVYPLISRVEGIAPGIYHYRTQDHALELIEALSVGQAAKLVTKFSAGQEYFAAAPVCLFFTCRFERLNYKYPEHAKAYKVAMMDVAHLSQTAYLVCTELELGACFYGAINDDNINRRLGLDGVSEGALAAFALGHPDPRGDGQEFSYEPYDPVAERRSGSR